MTGVWRDTLCTLVSMCKYIDFIEYFSAANVIKVSER
jgi:hypothetical protein